MNMGQWAPSRKIDDGALRLGKPYELDAGPDNAARSRSCVSHLTRDRRIDDGTGLKVHRDATIHMQPKHTVMPQAEKIYWIGVAEVDPHTKRGHVDDRALPPHVRWLVFDMATAHPKGRSAFCPSAILHVPAS
jgi:hypothetical protein